MVAPFDRDDETKDFLKSLHRAVHGVSDLKPMQAPALAAPPIRLRVSSGKPSRRLWRRLLNQSTHSSVANSTPSKLCPGRFGQPHGSLERAGAIREMARAYLPAALKKIGELVENPDPRVALAASLEILNRIFGRPVRAVESDVRKFDMNALYLSAVKLANGDPPAPEIVDVTPELLDDTPEASEPATIVTDW